MKIPPHDQPNWEDIIDIVLAVIAIAALLATAWMIADWTGVARS